MSNRRLMSCWLICVLAVVATVVVASGGVTVFVVPSAVAGTAPVFCA
jgi:t-SNARE complex subunit (syntaxin)